MEEQDEGEMEEALMRWFRWVGLGSRLEVRRDDKSHPITNYYALA